MQDLWDNIKRPNIQITGLEEREELETKGKENIK
jgi:hypothetical protein